MTDHYTSASELARQICGCANPKQHKVDIALILARDAAVRAEGLEMAAKSAEASALIFDGLNMPDNARQARAHAEDFRARAGSAGHD